MTTTTATLRTLTTQAEIVAFLANVPETDAPKVAAVIDPAFVDFATPAALFGQLIWVEAPADGSTLQACVQDVEAGDVFVASHWITTLHVFG